MYNLPLAPLLSDADCAPLALLLGRRFLAARHCRDRGVERALQIGDVDIRFHASALLLPQLRVETCCRVCLSGAPRSLPFAPEVCAAARALDVVRQLFGHQATDQRVRIDRNPAGGARRGAALQLLVVEALLQARLAEGVPVAALHGPPASTVSHGAADRLRSSPDRLLADRAAQRLMDTPRLARPRRHFSILKLIVDFENVSPNFKDVL